jgi:peptidoglycan/xylan/chitin deacetylase (PgdA/CDA1 family)
MAKASLVFGVTYHGSTDIAATGLDNVYGKHISAGKLREQLTWLARRFRIMTINQILEHSRKGTLPAKALFIAFHDGYRGNYQTAFPILKELGVQVDFFIPTAFIGTERRFWVDILDAALKYTSRPSLTLTSEDGETTIALQNETLRMQAAQKLRNRVKALPEIAFEVEFKRILKGLGWENPQDVPSLGDHAACLDWDQVREMTQTGMSFGSHTHSHMICAPQKEAIAREEMAKSKALIEQETGQPCLNFCYPNGSFPYSGNEATDRLAKAVGYHSALYMIHAPNLIHPGTFRLTGAAMGDDTSRDQLARSVSRLRYFWRRFRGNKIWLWEKDSL